MNDRGSSCMFSRLKRSNALSALIGKAIVPIVFPVVRFVKDQVFLSHLNKDGLMPSAFGWAVVFVARAWGYCRRIFRHEFDDYALHRYALYVRRHYGKGGRGYFSYANLQASEKAQLFGRSGGRIAPFIEHYQDLLKYADDDSYFDAGCGRGQNVKVLMERFPTSSIHGMDLSGDAADIVTLAVSDPRVTARPGDLTNIATLKAIGDDAYDHVILSHVLSIILGAGLDATRQTRGMIISELARIARKSLLIIDSPAIIADRERFEIEQLDRGAYHESILKYFDTLGGRTVILTSAESVAVLYQPS